MMTFQPNPMMDDLSVNHKDLDITNNKMSNLEWVTPKENNEHYRASDKFKEAILNIPFGEAQHLSKLTEQDVLDIRQLYKDNLHINKRKLREKYGVSEGTIRQVLNGTTWKHLLYYKLLLTPYF